MSDLPIRVRDLRLRRGWTQHHFATVTGISYRTIQRIERGTHKPKPETLQALAAPFDMDVSELLNGYSDAQLTATAENFVCRYCGAMLVHLTYVEHEYGDCEQEEFACGSRRGWSTRPCPKDPRFPTFEDYDLVFFEQADRTWHCLATGKTKEARQVDLDLGRGRTREDAVKWVRRSYIHARDGFAKAEEFLPMTTAVLNAS